MQHAPWIFNNKCILTASISYLLFGIQQRPFSVSLNIFKEATLNNNIGVTISLMFKRVNTKPCVCVYLVSVSQMLSLNVR